MKLCGMKALDPAKKMGWVRNPPGAKKRGLRGIIGPAGNNFVEVREIKIY